MAEWAELERRITLAKGGDAALDREVCDALGVPERPVTESAEDARTLLTHASPGWRLHVGYDVTGLFPYAALSLGERHIEATAPSLPLALLGVLAKFKLQTP